MPPEPPAGDQPSQTPPASPASPSPAPPASPSPAPPRDPVADLRRIGYLLERSHQETYRVRAFRGAAAVLAALPDGELAERSAGGTLTQLPGVGKVIAACVAQSLAGDRPEYLQRLESTVVEVLDSPMDTATAALRSALRGDCHTHSDWSDGGSPVAEMAATAIALGHEYMVLTDHSPRLTVARGLSAERLRQQLDLVAAINEKIAAGTAALAGDDSPVPRFRLLTGIEVDILGDGSLDQDPELLARLDVVVGSVHSALRDEPEVMTRRMVTALANPNLDILGHCTGRLVTGRGRAESRFDAEAVFAAAVAHGKAIEINSRPERLDPPKRLLRQALEAGCRFAIDTDAHAPGQLDWLRYGCERAVACGVPAERIVNTLPAGELLAWAASHR